MLPPPNANKKFTSFIGNQVTFDTVYPELIEIHNHVHITYGSVLLTHFLDTEKQGVKWNKGKIIIEENVFLGTRVIITKPVTIGKNSIVAAGSVVTKDIPSNEIWGGVPAKLIKKRKI